MRVLICGGRDYTDWTTIYRVLNRVLPTSVVAGGAAGADTIAVCWAKDHGTRYYEIPANWAMYGKSAGHRRNAEMLTLQPDLVIAFPGGKGTANMIQQALKAKVPVMTI